MTRRVLFSIAGSVGDLFPLIPVMLRLLVQGNDVRAAVMPGSLGFHLRPLGIPVVPLGRGNEASTLSTPGAVTTRFDGWASARRLADHLLGESLAESVVRLDEVVDCWGIDLIVSASFSPSSRIVARRRGLEHVDVSIYPKLARVMSTSGFGLRLRHRCIEQAGLPDDEIASPEATRLAWGQGPETVLLHDPAMLKHAEIPWWRQGYPEPVGLPYWGGPLHQQADVSSIDSWLSQVRSPTVLVTMGSFVGTGQIQAWRQLAEVLAGLGVRGLLIGPRRAIAEAVADIAGDFQVAGFLPFAPLAGRVSAFIHHGGLGTTFAALRAGTPSIVRPVAFDQGFNARVVESAGAGIEVGIRHTLRQALEQVLTTSSYQETCASIAAQLIPADVATDRVTDRLVTGTRWAA
jgi:UDP:flavonoid glycosyltransferase YjiC (YdhE family)